MNTDAAPRRHVYPGLNALRALGALMVLCTHAAFDTGQIVEGWTGAVFARMDYGVAIFFVLSGFLLTRPFLQRAADGRPAPSTGHYLWKRGLRILPLYWVTVLAAGTIDPENRGLFTPGDWLANLTLTRLYYPGLLPFGLNQMWSLATEVAFYLLLPGICLLLLRRRTFSERRILVTLGVLSSVGLLWLAWAATVPGEQGHFGQWLPGYFGWFAAGMALATISVADTLRPRSHAVHRLAEDPAGCWTVAVLLFAVACTPIAGPLTLDMSEPWEAVMKNILYASSATMLVLPLVFGDEQKGWIRRACNHRVPHFLGEISFGIFCLHMLILRGVFRAFDLEVFDGGFTEVLLTTLLLTIAAATIAYYTIERPLLRLKDSGPFVPTPTVATTKASTTSS